MIDNDLLTPELRGKQFELQQRLETVHVHATRLLGSFGEFTSITHFTKEFQELSTEGDSATREVPVEEYEQIDHVAAYFEVMVSSGVIPGEVERRDSILLLAEPYEHDPRYRLIHWRKDTPYPVDENESQDTVSEYIFEPEHSIDQTESLHGPDLNFTEHGIVIQELNDEQINKAYRSETKPIPIEDLDSDRVDIEMTLVMQLESVLKTAHAITVRELHN